MKANRGSEGVTIGVDGSAFFAGPTRSLEVQAALIAVHDESGTPAAPCICRACSSHAMKDDVAWAALAKSGDGEPQFLGDDIGDTIATITTLTPGQAMNSIIDHDGDNDYFRITLEANQTYVFSMARTAGGIPDAFLEIRDANGALLASNDDGGILTDAMIMFRAQNNGTHYVVAKGLDNGSSGGYTLRATPIETGSTTAEFYPSSKPIFSWTEAAHQLNRTGASWAGDFGQAVTITYSFRSTAPTTMPSETGAFSRFNAAQISEAEAALQAWAQVTNIHFVRVGTGEGDAAYSNDATIVFANYGLGQAGAAAFAYLPTSANTASSSLQGDIWVNITLDFNSDPELGEYGPHVLLHEIGHALGLSHPSDYAGSPTYAENAEYHADSRLFTVMSYFSTTSVGGAAWGNFASLPQMHDIAAIQRLYGVNTTTRIDDTVYGFNSNAGLPEYTLTSVGQVAGFTIWDAGGADTLDLSGYVTDSEIDIRQESFSSAGPGSSPSTTARLNVGIARGAVIENATGGEGNDQIGGNEIANLLLGGGGRDTMNGRAGDDKIHGGEGDDQLYGDIGADHLFGEAGADTLEGDPGNDTLDGGEGYDVAAYDGTWTSASIYLHRATIAVLSATTGADRLLNMEAVRWTDRIFSDLTELPAFPALAYIAGFDDLTQIYGLDADGGFNHYMSFGFTEGRAMGGFDALQYTAGFDDLIAAFGNDEDLAVRHFLQFGYSEGRDRDAFDGVSYVAGYADLIPVYGTNEHAAVEHYLTYGRAEGRLRDSFDELRYVAGYDDLIQAVGTNASQATRHWVESGFGEGRSSTLFDAAEYIASYVDLIGAIGADLARGVRHFIENGFTEGRDRDRFDAEQYLANYADLRAAYGADEHAAALHFIVYGSAEGRTDSALAPVNLGSEFAVATDENLSAEFLSSSTSTSAFAEASIRFFGESPKGDVGREVAQVLDTEYAVAAAQDAAVVEQAFGAGMTASDCALLVGLALPVSESDWAALTG